MWNRIRYLIRLAHTLYDVGIIRIGHRFIYEIKKLIGKIIPFFVLEKFIGEYNNQQVYLFLEERFIYKKLKNKNEVIKFNGIELFLTNKQIKLNNSFQWNDSRLERITIFHLHYFDWARKWLDYLIDNNEWSEYEDSLIYLIDNWIVNNNLRAGDGWHSYTISLRIRNWMWIFQFCPNLISQKRIKSTWLQFCWLHFNQEYCHGGNHYLENLISLIMVGMQFKGEFAKNIVKQAIDNLKKELNKQVLNDGGHEERSVSYHILVLDRLVELACFMEINYQSSSKWLLVHIKKMTKWCECVRLMKNKTPLFNDAAQDNYFSINEIIKFSNAFIEKKYINLKGLRGRLLSIIFGEKDNYSYAYKEIKYKNSLIDLPDTGWTILRPGNGWELIFKCGECCPQHLGAHAHSDLLSFDLFNNGNEIICETGTSIYKSGSKRNFERSIAAHNTLQLGKKINGKFVGVEPIDAWSSFRVGKKASCYNKKNVITNGWYCVQGSHDGFKILGGNHHRWIGIKVIKNIPILVIADMITSNRKVSLESYFHLSPNFDSFENFGSLSINSYLNTNNLYLNKKNFKGYYSRGFGLEEKRKSVKFSIDITEKLFGIFTIFTNPTVKYNIKNYSNYHSLKGEIDFGKFGKLVWDLKSKSFNCT